MRIQCFIALSLIFFSSCGKDENKNDQSLLPDVSQLEFWEPGAQKKISIAVLDKNNNKVSGHFNFSFQSENELVATVNSTGNVSAKSVGETTVVVRLGSIEARVGIIVDYATELVSGLVRYEDKIYDKDGFTGETVFKAARFVVLDIVDIIGNVQQTLSTDAKGQFSVNLPTNRNYNLYIFPKTNAVSGFNFEVRDPNNKLYALVEAINSTTLNIDMPLSVEFTPSFNILDVIITGAEFFQSFTQQQNFSLTAYWGKNAGTGTYYCTAKAPLLCENGQGIYVYNEVENDTDEYDDDVLWHEFAHYLSFIWSKDDSPGGCHFLDSVDLDLRLAWSEGWGGFFPFALKDWLSKDEMRKTLLSTALEMSTTRYVDTVFNGAQLSFDINNLVPDIHYSAANQASIARVLWEFYRIYDIESIWNVLDDYFKTSSEPANLELFWDGWVSLYQPTNNEQLILQDIMSEWKINYRDDSFENDEQIDMARMAVLGQAEAHNLYKADVPDVDIIAFNAQQDTTYSISTLNLSSGADTYLRVVDGQGSLVGSAENDDADPSLYNRFDSACGAFRVYNNATALASKLEFTAPSTGIFYAEISSSIGDDAYSSAGRYGDYEILIEAIP